jgi:hypothetical protein
MAAAVGVEERTLTFWRTSSACASEAFGLGNVVGALEKIVEDSLRRSGEGTWATLALGGADVPSTLAVKEMGSAIAVAVSFWSLPLAPPNSCRATEGGTEPISTSNSDFTSSAGSA